MLNIESSRRLDKVILDDETYERPESADERLVAADVLLWPAWDSLRRLLDLRPFDTSRGGLTHRLEEMFLLLCWRNTKPTARRASFLFVGAWDGSSHSTPNSQSRHCCRANEAALPKVSLNRRKRTFCEPATPSDRWMALVTY